MLRVKKIRTDGRRNEVRNELRQQQHFPSAKIKQRGADTEMHDERDERIEMSFRIIKKRIEAHPIKKHNRVAEQNREGMTDKKISEPFTARRFQNLFLRHEGIRADLRA